MRYGVHMTAKKKSRTGAAQQLIDSLLDNDEETSPRASTRGSKSRESVLTTDVRDYYNAVELNPDSDTPSFEIESPQRSSATVDDSYGDESVLLRRADEASEPVFENPRLETSDSVPPFDGTNPVVTRMASVDDKRFSSSSHEQAHANALDLRPSDDGNEKTVRLQVVAPTPGPLREPVADSADTGDDESAIDHYAPTEVRSPQSIHSSAASSAGRGLNQDSSRSVPASDSSDAVLKQSENLRLAQAKINELEQELERLRRENEGLSSAGETLRRRTDELLARAEQLECQTRETQKIADEEKKVLRGQMQSRDRENSQLKARLEELEVRLDSNFKRIRVRERELEHRLEIVKMESATLIGTKDKMILELKRQIDQLTHESEHGKVKTQELFSQFKEKQETIRRVVRALRIALTILEGDEDSASSLKKVD